MFKWTKRIVVGGVVLTGAGFLLLQTGLGSYIRSSGRMIKTAMEESIPVEFEIERARDLLEDLRPEIRANVRLVASEEVEVASLEREIERQREAVRREAEKLQSLRATLKTESVSYRVGGHVYRRDELVEDLARRFDHLKTAEMLLGGKEDLLRNRRRSLEAALAKLEKTRRARIELASQIESLEAQFHLIQAQSAGSEFQLDETKLARTQKAITDLKKRLAIAQRALAREARFVELIPVEPVNETALVDRVDSYLAERPELLEAPGLHPADAPVVANAAD